MPKKKLTTYSPSSKALNIREKVFSAMLLMVVGIMPLITRFTIVRAAPELVDLLGQEAYMDFFAHYKGWFLGIPAIVMAFYAIADWLGEGMTKAKLWELVKPLPVATACVFLFMALLSTIFSSYRHTSWFGSVERGEGMFIFLAYFIVFFSAMYYTKADKHAKIIMYGLAFSSIIMGLIGLSQFIGRDFFGTRLGARLVMGAWDAALAPRFQIANGTLYNPNTFGIYTAMTAPILLACALVYDGRKWMRIVFLVGGVLMLIGVIGSASVGGLVGITAAVGVTVLTLVCRFVYQARLRRKEENENTGGGKHSMITWLVSSGVLAALLVGLFFVPTVNQRLDFLLGRVEHAIRHEAPPRYDYIFDGDRLTVTWQDEEKFSLVLLEETYGPDRVLWHIYDANGQPIPLINRELIPIEDQPRNVWPAQFEYDIPYRGRINITQNGPFAIIHGLRLHLHEGRIHVLAPNLRDLVDPTVPIPSIGFEGRETWGSNRGHIWSRTFPLIPARTFIGSGPDTYVLVFPQNDFIGKMQSHGNPYLVIGMAHNVYLQTWVTTGGISALALIFLFGYYLFTTFVHILRSRMKEGMFIFGLQFGLLAGISAFCVSALATDSTIGSSGVFYLLLGLGFGVNYLVGRVYHVPDEVEKA